MTMYFYLGDSKVYHIVWHQNEYDFRRGIDESIPEEQKFYGSFSARQDLNLYSSCRMYKTTYNYAKNYPRNITLIEVTPAGKTLCKRCAKELGIDEHKSFEQWRKQTEIDMFETL